MQFRITAILLSINIFSTTAFYADNDLIVDLTPKNFESEVFDDTRLWFVEFYAPWCGHCKKLAPDFSKAAELTEKYSIKFGAVDADEHKELAGRFGVQGFPTLKVFADKARMNPYTNKKFRPAVDYNGARTVRGMKKTLMNMIPSYVSTVVDKEGLDKALSASAEGGLNTALVFATKERVSPIISGVGSVFGETLSIVQVYEDDEEEDGDLAKEYGVTDFPAIMLVDTATKKNKPTKFKGKMKPQEISKFLAQFAVEKKEEKKAGSTFPFTVPINDANFAKSVDGSKRTVIILYTKGGKLPKASADEFDEEEDEEEDPVEAFNALSKQAVIDGINVGHVDCDGEGVEETCKAVGKRKKLPALIIFTPDSGDGPAQKSKVYPADHADSVFDIAVKNIPKVAFAIPPNGMQQFLSVAHQNKKIPVAYLAKGNEVPPVLHSIGFEFREDIQVGMFQNPSKELRKQFNAKKLPHLVLMFPQPSKDPKAEKGAVEFGIAMFDPAMFGPHSANGISAWLRMLLKQLNPEKAKQQSNEEQEQAPPKASNRKFEELTADNFDGLCRNLCVVGIVNGNNETAKSSIEVLEKVFEKKKSLFQVVWIDGSCQKDFAEGFGLQAESLPVVVVYLPRKKKYVRFIGSFSASSLNNFLGGKLRGAHEIKEVLKPKAGLECPVEVEEPVVEEDDDDDMAAMLAEIKAEEERKEKELEEAIIREAEEAKKAAEDKARQERLKKLKAERKKKKKKSKKKKKKKGKKGKGKGKK